VVAVRVGKKRTVQCGHPKIFQIGQDNALSDIFTKILPEFPAAIHKICRAIVCRNHRCIALSHVQKGNRIFLTEQRIFKHRTEQCRTQHRPNLPTTLFAAVFQNEKQQDIVQHNGQVGWTPNEYIRKGQTNQCCADNFESLQNGIDTPCRKDARRQTDCTKQDTQKSEAQKQAAQWHNQKIRENADQRDGGKIIRHRRIAEQRCIKGDQQTFLQPIKLTPVLLFLPLHSAYTKPDAEYRQKRKLKACMKQIKRLKKQKKERRNRHGIQRIRQAIERSAQKHNRNHQCCAIGGRGGFDKKQKGKHSKNRHKRGGAFAPSQSLFQKKCQIQRQYGQMQP